MNKLNNITTLYYVDTIQTENNDGNNPFEYITGWKYISVYFIEDGIIKKLCDIEALITTSSEYKIQNWLDKEGYEQEFNMEQL